MHRTRGKSKRENSRIPWECDLARLQSLDSFLYFCMTKGLQYLTIVLMLALPLSGQDHPSVHQLEWELHRDGKAPLRTLPPAPELPTASAATRPNGVIYGFHPYWQNGSEGYYQYDLLSHLVYFSADVDPVTGGFTSTHSYSTAAVITQAKNAGVKVHLCIVLFSKHDSLWAKQSRQDALINNILARVKERNIDGVNIDFESMKSTDAAPFKKFILQLGDSLKANKKELCVELFAVDWNTVFPASFFTDVNAVVDQYFIMLYDYYYSGSTTAGPIAPLRTSSATGYHVLKSIDTYLSRNCPPAKLIAGFPYYGIDWPVSSNVRMASTTATGTSRLYNSAKNNYLDTIKASDKFFDATYASPWYRYQSGATWRQAWIEDSVSLAMKYDSVKTKKIAGIGMWALGYDAPEKELWNLLRAKFTSPNAVQRTAAAPSTFGLDQNYPNPFNPSTSIGFQLSAAGMTTLIVYDMLGREMARLTDDMKEPGSYSVRFEASGLASGVYYYTLRSGTSVHSRRMLLVK